MVEVELMVVEMEPTVDLVVVWVSMVVLEEQVTLLLQTLLKEIMVEQDLVQELVMQKVVEVVEQPL